MRLTRTASAWLLLAPVGAILAAVPAGVALRFDRLDGDYVDLAAEVEPIRSGPMTVRLSSPENRFTLAGLDVKLEPFGEIQHRGEATARFRGAGRLKAEIDFSGVPGSFESKVEFPPQEVAIAGKVEIERSEDGYTITVVDLPAFLEIEMRSELADQLVGWCSRIALFVAGSAGCGDLDHRLSHPRLPLPATGETLFVAADQLTSIERDQIDVYLGGF